MVEIDYRDAVAGEYYLMSGSEPKAIFFIKFQRRSGREFFYNLPAVYDIEDAKIRSGFRSSGEVYSVAISHGFLERDGYTCPLVLFKLTEDEVDNNILMELVIRNI